MKVKVKVDVDAGGFPGIDPAGLERALVHVLASEDVREGTVGLQLLDDEAIQALNRRWLGRDRPTDVLAFALHEPGRPVLGDIYVGYQQAARQAETWGVPLAEELTRLAIHGALHVLGHDHPDEERESSPFFERQEALLAELATREGGTGGD